MILIDDWRMLSVPNVEVEHTSTSSHLKALITTARSAKRESEN
jgi:hypothetical protein